jgi:uncharacterized protein YbjT (DUF2867 family)
MSLPILVVTSPTGKQASHFLPLVTSPDASTNCILRLAAHTSHSANTLCKRYPDAEVVTADLTSLDQCQSLLEGATACLHIGPSFHSHELSMGINMVDAAVAETEREGSVFRHFVYSSVLSSQHRLLLQHNLKSYVEERLFLTPTGSRMGWTVLQPTNFMDAFPVADLAEQAKGGKGNVTMERLWNPDVGMSMIALDDLAEAAAKVLQEGERHYFAQYPLCSTLPTSARQVASIIGQHINADIRIKQLPFEEAVGKFLGMLYGEHSETGIASAGDLRADLARDGAERLLLTYDRHGLVGSPNVLRWLLGREPMGIEDWVREQLLSLPKLQ